jgi:type VI secretion system FHA domain protein
MALTLRVTSYNNQAPAQAMSVTVTESGCSIGRADDNDFVLPDLERIISHHHASIQFDNGVWYLTDNSTNGSFVNHSAEPVGQGARVAIHDGDVLNIGKYECAVSTEVPQMAQQGAAQNAGSVLSDALLHPPYHQVAEKPAWEKKAQREPYREPAAKPAAPSRAEPALAVEESYFSPPEAIPEEIPEDWDELTGFSKKKTGTGCAGYPGADTRNAQSTATRLQTSQPQATVEKTGIQNTWHSQ